MLHCVNYIKCCVACITYIVCAVLNFPQAPCIMCVIWLAFGWKLPLMSNKSVVWQPGAGRTARHLLWVPKWSSDQCAVIVARHHPYIHCDCVCVCVCVCGVQPLTAWAVQPSNGKHSKCSWAPGRVPCIRGAGAPREVHQPGLDRWPGVKCGSADVVTGNLRILLRINIRKLPCVTSAHPQNTHVWSMTRKACSFL